MRHPFVTATTPRPPAHLLAAARARPVPRVALVNAGGATALQGLREAAEAGFAEPVLLGDPDRIRRTAEEIGWDIAPFRLIPAPRENAGPAAADLVQKGEADSIMKGQIHTSTFLKGLLPRAAGLRIDGQRAAHIFHLSLPGDDRPLLLTDAALNTAPDIPTRQAALTHAVALARALGNPHPMAAILAPSEDVTPTIPSTGEAAAIAAWARSALPGATVEGPLALDLALSADSAAIKGYAGQVPGRTDILLVPEIGTGNALFKLMSLGMAACAAGVVMGLRVPLLLTSRSQGAADRIASAALGMVAAGMMR